MTSQQRRVLAGLGALVALLLVVLLVVTLTGGGGSHGRPLAAGGATTTTLEPGATTTSDLVPETTTTAAAGSSRAPTSTSPPTTTARPAPIVTGEGAVLAPPATPVRRALVGGCQSLADPGWTVDCGTAHAARGDLVWLIENQPDGASRAYVFRRGSGNEWVSALTATDDDHSRFGRVRARVADVSGDGADEIEFGFLEQGSGAILGVDLVDGSQTVVVHRDLDQGRARVATGELDVWSGHGAPGDPACCPSAFDHGVIRFTGGAWRLVSVTTEPTSSVPPSQL